MSILLYLISLIRINPSIFPNVSGIYQKKLNIPIFGKQIIEAEIITNNYALIKLEGIINEKGTIRYIHKNNNHFMKFSYNLRKVIKKYKTELSSPHYDIENDQFIFDINVKVINYNTKIKMSKIL
jgi:hypothetical protein